MSIKLRELIRAVRACKTAQEERAVIAKECALIRTAFKDNNLAFRHRNVAKLLFIHMLGYPSHFGQMECLKLIASPNFPEKRIGYLALMLLLDERTEVLTLVTNSLKNDLAHESQFVVGLALTSVGNLATNDMARTLAPDVAKHLLPRSGAANPYTRKKAALTMIRVFRRVPEVIEDYLVQVVGLLKDRAHGVLIAGVQLMTEALLLSETLGSGDQRGVAHAACKADFQRVVPSLVKMLRNLLNLGYSPEHDIAGIADPFLQVKLVRLLALLGHKNEEASEAMNDVLAQVATNTETNRNAGNAILYECVRCIMTIESESGLRVLAINILGRFLLNRDNNIRYVALNSLSKVVSEDLAAVQRHRATILECLKDPDVSIRQRALELTYQLVDAANVRELTREMLNYLVVAPVDHRAALCSKIMTVVEKYAPTPRWQVETLCTMLGVAGNHCDDSVACSTVGYVCLAPEGLHGFAAHKLFGMLRDDLAVAQVALIHVAVWCCGEFGDLLMQPAYAPESEQGEEKAVRFEALPVEEILGLLDAVLKSHLANSTTKAYVLTALLKLTARLGAGAHGQAETADLIASFETSMSLELQQRSCEYKAMLEAPWDAPRADALARMPALDAAAVRAARQQQQSAAAGFSQMDSDGSFGMDSPTANAPAASFDAPNAAPVAEKSLLDLDDIFGSEAPAAPQGRAAQSGPSDVDLLSDIFSSPAPPPPQMQQQQQQQQAPVDIFGSSMPFDAAPPAAPAHIPQLKAFEKNGLTVTMDMTRDPADSHAMTIVCSFLNSGKTDFERFVFQAAVPKYVQMEMKPASGATVAAGTMHAPVTQVVRVRNTQPKPLMVKIKITYVCGGRQIEEQAQVSAFPAL
ncbi:adaptin N terminal region-domain-containing protein [Pelagophyceae sp. CCMP2097]|nr:adaptin N terminal region-domain-containing protein [Pelagophyceae sp. CCMP2097]